MFGQRTSSDKDWQVQAGDSDYQARPVRGLDPRDDNGGDNLHGRRRTSPIYFQPHPYPPPYQHPPIHSPAHHYPSHRIPSQYFPTKNKKNTYRYPSHRSPSIKCVSTIQSILLPIKQEKLVPVKKEKYQVSRNSLSTAFRFVEKYNHLTFLIFQFTVVIDHFIFTSFSSSTLPIIFLFLPVFMFLYRLISGPSTCQT